MRLYDYFVKMGGEILVDNNIINILCNGGFLLFWVYFCVYNYRMFCYFWL